MGRKYIITGLPKMQDAGTTEGTIAASPEEVVNYFKANPHIVKGKPIDYSKMEQFIPKQYPEYVGDRLRVPVHTREGVQMFYYTPDEYEKVDCNGVEGCKIKSSGNVLIPVQKGPNKELTEKLNKENLVYYLDNKLLGKDQFYASYIKPPSKVLTEELDGGSLPKAQNGATAADSLALYNNSLDKIRFYKNNPYYKKVPDGDIYYGTDFKNPDIRKKLIKDSSTLGKVPKSLIDDLINRTNSNQYGKSHPLSAAEISKLKKQIGKKRFGNVPGTNLTSFGDILLDDVDDYYNPLAPPIYLHPNITPQGSETYASKRYADISNIPYYDPIAIKPGSMLTDEEVKKRYKKYGPKGIPASKLEALGLSANNVIITTNTGKKIPYNIDNIGESVKAPEPSIPEPVISLKTKKALPIDVSSGIDREMLPTNVSSPYTDFKPAKVASRSQTVMEPDPYRPGKYRVKELRNVPYQTTKLYTQGDVWEDEHAPRVIWTDAEGDEYETKPGLNPEDAKKALQTNPEAFSFQDGGSIEYLTQDEIDNLRAQGIIVVEE